MLLFLIKTWIKPILPFTAWYPFNPYQTQMRFTLTQIFESLCVACVTATNLSINSFIFVVFICLNFYYSLLSYRATRAGHQTDGNPKQSKNAIYREMIELVNAHLKINK